MRLTSKGALTALLSTLVLGALTPAAASAHAWKLNGESITKPVNVTAKAKVTLHVSDMSQNIYCTYELKGTANPGAVGEITSITNATGGKILSCESGECSNLKAEAEALNLPWNTEIVKTKETPTNAILPGSSKKTPEWKIDCAHGGVRLNYECPNETLQTLKNGLEGVEAITYTPLSHACYEAPKSGINLNIEGSEVLKAATGKLSAS